VNVNETVEQWKRKFSKISEYNPLAVAMKTPKKVDTGVYYGVIRPELLVELDNKQTAKSILGSAEKRPTKLRIHIARADTALRQYLPL